MSALMLGLVTHRIRPAEQAFIVEGNVRWFAAKSLSYTYMALLIVISGALKCSDGAFAPLIVSINIVLLFGHSLGSQRKLTHHSFQCSRWLERARIPRYSGWSCRANWLASTIQASRLCLGRTRPPCHSAQQKSTLGECMMAGALRSEPQAATRCPAGGSLRERPVLSGRGTHLDLAPTACRDRVLCVRHLDRRDFRLLR